MSVVQVDGPSLEAVSHTGVVLKDHETKARDRLATSSSFLLGSALVDPEGRANS